MSAGEWTILFFWIGITLILALLFFLLMMRRHGFFGAGLHLGALSLAAGLVLFVIGLREGGYEQLEWRAVASVIGFSLFLLGFLVIGATMLTAWISENVGSWRRARLYRSRQTATPDMRQRPPTVPPPNPPIFSDPTGSLRGSEQPQPETLKQEAYQEARSPDEPDRSSENVKDQLTSLEQYARNLTELALQARLTPVVGRDDDIRRVIRTLCRTTKSNPVLVGEAGVGKTAVIEGLADRIAVGEVPEALMDKEIYEIDLTAVSAGITMRGMFEERIRALIRKPQSVKT